jgi:tyrosine-protein kinase Etk/Wzc
LKHQSVDYIESDELPEARERRYGEYLAMILRGKWIILGCLCVGIGGMALYTRYQKPVYQASATVLINPKAGQGVNPLSQLTEGASRSNIPNEIAILRSRSLAESAVHMLLDNPYLNDAKTEKLRIVQRRNEQGDPIGFLSADYIATRLLGSLEFNPQRESDIIMIMARSDDPREAAVLANVYAQAYQDQTMMQSRARSRSVREFLESRLSEQRRGLQQAEGSVKGFMESAGVVSLDNESGRIVQELSQFEASRNAMNVDIEGLSKRLASMQGELPQAESSVSASITQAIDPYIRQMQEQLATLETQRDVITTQNDAAVLAQPMYKQRLDDLADQINGLREKLQARSKEFIESSLRSEGGAGQADPLGYIRTLKAQILETKLQLETLRSRRTALEGIILQYESKFKQIPRQTIEFAQLQRERLSSERLYSLIEERYNQAAITEKSEFGYVDIIDRAAVPGRPTSPNPQKNLLLGLLAGLGLGVALVLGKEAMDVKIRTPEQLRKRGFVSLAEIYPMHRELKKLQRDDRLPREVKRFNPNLWLIFDPLSYVAESYRRLRTNILRAQVKEPIKTIVLTSPNPGEGKSTTVSNLAIALAETEKRILLVDADLRRPTVHTNFGVALKPGLTEYLAGKATIEEVTQQKVLEGLDVIACGSLQRQPARILASSSMQAFLSEARELYDLILIDAPPVLVVNDAALVSGIVDYVILTVASGETRAATLDRAAEFVDQAGGSILGVVLNRFDARREYGGYYGGHRYGHYRSYLEYYGPNGKGAKTPAGMT